MVEAAAVGSAEVRSLDAVEDGGGNKPECSEVMYSSAAKVKAVGTAVDSGSVDWS